MSVLIKGMEMPDNCTDCWFRKTARHEYLSDCQLCPFTGDTTPYLTRDKKCPLVPVPPHGDLIDRRDAIIDANKRAYDFWLSDDEVNATIQFLDEQTAVIPAEESV